MSNNFDPFTSDPNPNKDPFTPQPTNSFDPTADPFAQSDSYTLGAAKDKRQYVPKIHTTRMLAAPWPLLLAAGCYIISAGYLAYDMISVLTAGQNLNDIRAGITIVAMLCLVGFSVITLKAQEWGRIALSVLSGLGVLLVVVPKMWILTLIGIIAVVLLWLPINKAWFGYRA